jgi:hypothetical protein
LLAAFRIARIRDGECAHHGLDTRVDAMIVLDSLAHGVLPSGDYPLPIRYETACAIDPVYAALLPTRIETGQVSDRIQ